MFRFNCAGPFSHGGTYNKPHLVHPAKHQRANLAGAYQGEHLENVTKPCRFPHLLASCAKRSEEQVQLQLWQLRSCVVCVCCQVVVRLRDISVRPEKRRGMPLTLPKAF